MDRQQLISRIDELINHPDFRITLVKEVDRIIDSGQIAYEEEEKHSYAIAKVVLCIALKEFSHQYMPFSEGLKNIVKNYGGR